MYFDFVQTPADGPTGGLCPAGSYCPLASSSPFPCPPGTFSNNTGHSRPEQCAICPPGTLLSSRVVRCSSLSPSQYCGSYSDQTGGDAVQHCRPCEAGFFCSRAGLCRPQGLCDPGHYCTSGASTASPVALASGGVCSAGYICPRGTMFPQQHPCPVGTWSSTVGAQNLSSCWPCPPGLYCNSSGLRQPTGVCDTGYYCSGGAVSSRPSDGVTGDICPLGHYCPMGSLSPVLCPDGTHSNTTGAEACEDCPSGTYCLSGEGVQPCPAGHYCLGGGVEGILPCPPGTYSPHLGLNQVEQCLICPAGFFCEDWGLFEPTGPCQAGYYCIAGVNFQNPDGNFSTGVGGACPKGRYCPEGTSLPLPCPAGTFSNSLHLTDTFGCSPCPAGQFCGTAGLTHPSGLCQVGYFCPGGDTAATGSEGGLCPPAHYCPEGSERPLSCPAGTHTNLTGQSACTRCPAGYYCPEKTGNFTKFPCPPGFYCPDGTQHATQFPCPRGYYNPEPMTQSLDSCLPCPPGHYCEKERLTKVSGKCKAGWFCVSAAWNSQPFDLDNYTNANCLCPATSTGGRCQVGFYCPLGSSEPLACPPGSFCNISGLALPMGPCSPGYYCVGGATEARPTDGETGSICPPGTYCVEGSGEPEVCPAGTFSSVPGLTSEAGCQPCTPGFYCRGAGLKAPTGPCSEGYWCPPGQTVATAMPCPPGYFCSQGSATPKPCPSGTYQDRDKQAACTVCEAGYYCDMRLANASVQRPCPEGHYCPAGTALATQYPCPMGSFNPRQGMDSHVGCTPCAAGHYCPSVGLPEPAGFYCPKGTGFDLRGCPEGTYGPDPGYWSVSQCRQCDGGHYCSSRNGTAVTGPCQEGYYCSHGNISPQPFLKTAGEGGPCPAGHYCPQASIHPLPCPRGTFSNLTKLVSQEDCQPCLPGYYCDIVGLSAPSGECWEGFFCLEGADRPDPPLRDSRGGPCPKGYYCSKGSVAPRQCPLGTISTDNGLASCSACPQGFYCPGRSNGSLSRSYECPVGYYCPSGTWSKDQFPCPVGSINPHTRMAKPQDCTPCPPGSFCAAPGKGVTSGQCDAGYYCLSGAWSPTPQDGGTTGFLCAIRGLSFPFQICPAGFYCPSRDNSSKEASLPCSPGNMCPPGSDRPVPCPPGTFQDLPGQDTIALQPEEGPAGGRCSAGSYCPEGTSSMAPCPAGTFGSIDGAVSIEACQPCLPGHYCAEVGLSSPSGPCNSGFYCTEGSKTATPLVTGRTTSPSPLPADSTPGQFHGDVCPAGHYCPKGSAKPSPCPPGTFLGRSAAESKADCEACYPGSYCPLWAQTSVDLLCPPGWFCPQRSVSGRQPEYQCPPGHACPSGSAEPTICSPGTFQSLSGQSTCNTCPPGFYCEAGSSVPSLCPMGSIIPSAGRTSLTDCFPCPSGSFCNRSALTEPTGPCNSGHFCSLGSTEPSPVAQPYGDVCPMGHFCPQGSGSPKPCPVGSFLPEPGASSPSHCQPCPPGKYCLSPASSAPTGPCFAGFFCTGGADRSTPQADSSLFSCLCEILELYTEKTSTAFWMHNRSCFNNSKETYAPEVPLVDLQLSPASCVPRVTTANREEKRSQVAGVQKVTTVLKDRAQRHHNNICAQWDIVVRSEQSGLVEEAQCQSCSPGFYCSESGLPAVSGPCLPDVFPGLNDFARLVPGFIWPERVSSLPSRVHLPLPRSQPHQGELYWGLQSSALRCWLCLSERESRQSQLSNCVHRDEKQVNAGQGSFAAGAPAEQMSLFAQLVSSALMEHQPLCLVQQEHLALNQATHSKKTAPPVPLDTTAKLKVLCSLHCVLLDTTVLEDRFLDLSSPAHLAPCRTSWEPMVLSPAYSALLETSALALVYPSQQDSVREDTSVLLDQQALPLLSMYARVAAQVPLHLQVPMATSAPLAIAVLLAQQMRCLVSLALTILLLEQPAAYYAPKGACVPPQPLKSLRSAQLGYFCQGGAMEPTPLSSENFPRNGPCPVGHYCPAGCLSPLPCPLGSIRNTTGGVSMESCSTCPAGHYCSTEGLSNPSGPCAAGFYCPYDFSSTTPYAFLCPKGHYCPEGSALALPCPTGEYQPNPGSDSCIPCRPGFYCEEAIVGEPLPCPPHSFCPAGTMVPQPCPNGTYTHSNQGGLQEERECSPCPPGRFCRAGRIQGVCAAGYLCVSGSAEFTPQTPMFNLTQCQWGMQCAGPCPPGFFCPEGMVEAQSCPVNTIRTSPGGASLQDCLSCPPQHWCKPGDPVLHLCPAGHYCDGVPGSDFTGGTGPRPCPPFTYRASPGASSKGDCLPCPPGSYCNSTGLTDFSSSPCPPGLWCSGSGPPIPCPAGTKRLLPGAAAPSQCEPCAGGTFCPDPRLTGTPNVDGIPCRASYQCPIGAVSEMLCRAGSFCGPQTAEPPVCPEGYFCPEGSQSYHDPKQLCPFPYYCPANSSAMKSCEGGSMPINTSGLRGSKSICCSVCEGGTYRPYLSPILQCVSCPPGYFCPPGTDHYKSNTCSLGYVCPMRSTQPIPCPPGTFGNLTHGETIMGDCHPCPAGTFNHLPAQKACFPCGSSSTSLAGSSSCTCLGKNRAFHPSDGSCLCRTGFIFYNELDFKSFTSDSELDCQPEVNKRCATGQVRLASSRDCVSPSLHSCNITCGPHGGNLDVEMGICQCERYVSAEELCNTSCLSSLPQLSAKISTDGNLLLSLKERGSMVWVRTLMNVLGPDIHAKNIGKIHLVQFDPEGVFGWIPTQEELIHQFLSEPLQFHDTRPRQRRDTKLDDDANLAVLPRIPNPIACLTSGDMLIFRITINQTARQHSHFPVYQKDHLFNSNPSWDFGAFRRLQILMKQTSVNATSFAHVFTETGKYTFVDSAVPEWSLVVVVSGEGTECDPRASVFQPMTPAQLVKLGIVKQHRLNLLPDWGVIAGILILLLVVVVVLTTTVLVLRPGKAKLVSQWRMKPKWRSLGEPICPVDCTCSAESIAVPSHGGFLGSRGVGEGAEAEEPVVTKGGSVSGRFDLEDFNVKTLYDKLEDQNLHIASQLARHRKDTQEFYRNICQHTETLTNVFENMDGKKLSHLKELLANNAMTDKPSNSSAAERDTQAEASLVLLGALLRSVEALLCRLKGEAWQNQDMPGPPYCHTGAHDARECEQHAGDISMCYTQFSPVSMAKADALPHEPVPLQSTAPCLSDHDLSKLVSISPLFRTLQEIQQSLHNLTTAEANQNEHYEISVQDNHDGHLIPTALESLSPNHSAVFLFGCQMMQLLANCPLFPSVLLLLAKSIPVSPASSNRALLAHCSRDFYFDRTNHILYLSEVKLQHAGHFMATILQAMAYIASGSKSQSFMQALHEAISALSLQLFNSSFKWSTAESKWNASEGRQGAFVEDFLNIRVPSEQHFTEHLLANRLEKYKYFKLEQLILNLKQSSTENPDTGFPPKGTPIQMSCVEGEIDRLNECFLQLSVQLQKRTQIGTWLKESEDSAAGNAASATPTGMPSLSRNGTILLELKRRYVSQRLDQLQTTLGHIRRCQQHDSKSREGTRGRTQTDSSNSTQQGQCQDSSHSQQTTESRGLGPYNTESHISDQQWSESLLDCKIIESQNQLPLKGPGEQDECSHITIENTTEHTDIDDIWGSIDQKLDLNKEKC
ncbi:uncharacterized protein LKV04_010315 [Tautogolabrus adspersus]